MKKRLITMSLLATLFISSCSDSASDEFDNANGNAAVKYIKTITSNSSENGLSLVTVNYDSFGKVISVTDGTDSSVFIYENNDLKTVTGDGDPFEISELYQAPYETYEFGDVLAYDSNGNPTDVKLFQEDDFGNMEAFTAKITYGTAPNAFFYTMKAAGIIDVLDEVELNLNMQGTPAEIVQARVMLPLNNPTKLIIKNSEGSVVSTTLTSYVYNSFNYPTSAIVVTTEDGSTETVNFTFTYKE